MLTEFADAVFPEFKLPVYPLQSVQGFYCPFIQFLDTAEYMHIRYDKGHSILLTYHTGPKIWTLPADASETAEWGANSIDPDQILYSAASSLGLHCLLRLLSYNLTLILLFTTTPTFANSVDPDQMASEEAIWSGSTLFVIQFVNLNENIIWCNLIGW